MLNHYLLWAAGPDHPGIVSAVTKDLYNLDCNLEDSSMMRLGAEFAMFVIFSSHRVIYSDQFSSVRRRKRLLIGVKKISARMAKFIPFKDEIFVVRLNGQDKQGIVYELTNSLAKNGFNISDLTTHRTGQKNKAGFVLLIEGELKNKNRLRKIQSDLNDLSRRLKARISFEKISSQTI